jgi:uncharacterized protein (DUF1015 family)
MGSAELRSDRIEECSDDQVMTNGHHRAASSLNQSASLRETATTMKLYHVFIVYNTIDPFELLNLLDRVF